MKTVLHRIIVLALMLLCSGVGFSQKNDIKKANKDFKEYAFIDAREIYLKVLEDGYESAEIYQKLGDTYYFNSEYGKAAEYYGLLTQKFPDEVEAIYYYRAAQSLRSIGDTSGSEEMMEQYAAVGGNDAIVNTFSQDPVYLEGVYKIEKAAINSDASDFGTSYYGDKLVFASTSKNTEGNKTHEWSEQPYLDLYVADMDAEGKLSNVTSLDGEINTPYHESSAVFTKDGGTMYFTRNNYIDGKKGKDRGRKAKTVRLKLYKATKSGDNFWTNIMELPFNSDSYSVAHPALSLDGKRLYFSSDMPGATGEQGQSDLWYVDILEDNSYSAPVNMGPSINTEARESFPFISKENNLYFSSDGRSGLGGFDVYVTPLNDQGMATTISNLPEPVNSGSDDFGFIFQEDKRVGYLSSNRDGEGGSVDDEIYRVEEGCEITIVGDVTNGATGEILPGAVLTLLDENSNVIGTTVADANGRYEFTAMADCSSTYLVRGKADNCEYNEVLIEQTPNETSSINVDMPLTCDPCPPNDLGCRLSLQPIYFDFDRYNIRPDAAIELAKILAALREYKQLIIHIESHTDSRGNDSYNEALSEKRAQSTLNWLVDQGIERSRLSAKGYGESQLVNECSNGADCTEEAHQLNRRSMFIIQN